MVRLRSTALCAALLCLPLVLAGCGVDLDAPVAQSSDAATFTPAPTTAPASPTAEQHLSAGASPTNTIQASELNPQNSKLYSVDVSIDINKHHPISPLIYGL